MVESICYDCAMAKVIPMKAHRDTRGRGNDETMFRLKYIYIISYVHIYIYCKLYVICIYIYIVNYI